VITYGGVAESLHTYQTLELDDVTTSRSGHRTPNLTNMKLRFPQSRFGHDDEKIYGPFGNPCICIPSLQ